MDYNYHTFNWITLLSWVCWIYCTSADACRICLCIYKEDRLQFPFSLFFFSPQPSPSSDFSTPVLYNRHVSWENVKHRLWCTGNAGDRLKTSLVSLLSSVTFQPGPEWTTEMNEKVSVHQRKISWHTLHKHTCQREYQTWLTFLVKMVSHLAVSLLVKAPSGNGFTHFKL